MSGSAGSFMVGRDCRSLYSGTWQRPRSSKSAPCTLQSSTTRLSVARNLRRKSSTTTRYEDAKSYCGMRPSSTGVASDSKLKKSTMAKVGASRSQVSTLSVASRTQTSTRFSSGPSSSSPSSSMSVSPPSLSATVASSPSSASAASPAPPPTPERLLRPLRTS